MKDFKRYQWAIVGAGPAGIAAVGNLLDSNVEPKNILWIDPKFKVGDFGQKWGEVSSNTNVELFLKYLNEIKSLNYSNRPQKFNIDTLDPENFVRLEEAAEPLQWATDQLLDKVSYSSDLISELFISQSLWNLKGTRGHYMAEKVILATGSLPKSLNLHNFEITKEIPLATALAPSKLAEVVSKNDKVAVFGSSHSAMIIIRALLELGIDEVGNFYRHPLKYAIDLGDWTLYDNSGLKGETAKWARKSISANLDNRIKRYLSTGEEVNKNLHKYNKVIYAVGFDQRSPSIESLDPKLYDVKTGIIAPGLFGVGIGFARKIVDPYGNIELNVGLFKFMRDIKQLMPLWMKYNI